MRAFSRITLLSACLAGSCGLAQATALVVNSPVNSVDQVGTFFGGTLLASVTTMISNISYNGIARSAVYDTGTGLDFYYQFSNDASSINGVERFTGYNFASLGSTGAVSVAQTSAAFGIFVAGTEISDGADRTGLGVIGFSFVPNGASKINPGTTSFTQIIRTDARAYTTGNFGLLNGYGDNAYAFAPTAVPEPSTYAMLAGGLGLMGWVVSRRRKQR